MATNTSRSSGGSTTDVDAKAKAKASELKDKAQDEAEDRLAQGKSKATGALEDVVSALHETGDALRDRDRDTFAHYADAAADQVEQFTRSIRNRNVGELLDEAQRFARRDAGLFIGGTFLLGILGARFLKASAPESSRSRYGYRSPSYGSGSAGGSRSSGSRSSDYANEPPYRVRNTASGEMPSPDATRLQALASASETRSSAT